MGRQVLLFRHPKAGIQVPAGTVEEDEGLETAVLREVTEETRLIQVRIVGYLGKMENELDPDSRVITRPIQARLESNTTSIPFKKVFTRGYTVQFEGRQGSFTKISYMEYDQLPNPTCIDFQIVGWVPNDTVRTRKPRHFFHLRCEEETTVSWSLPADNNHTFYPFWTPLIPKPTLIYPQQVWLNQVYDQLTTEFV